jgi:hypothetical protein
MKTEFKIVYECPHRRSVGNFWCYAVDADDAIKQAHALRPRAFVRSVESTGRVKAAEDRLHPMFAAIVQPMKGGAM